MTRLGERLLQMRAQFFPCCLHLTASMTALVIRVDIAKFVFSSVIDNTRQRACPYEATADTRRLKAMRR
jgi:hypothetical protein